MIKIIGARGCGKTTKILKISEKTHFMHWRTTKETYNRKSQHRRI